MSAGCVLASGQHEFAHLFLWCTSWEVRPQTNVQTKKHFCSVAHTAGSARDPSTDLLSIKTSLQPKVDSKCRSHLGTQASSQKMYLWN